MRSLYLLAAALALVAPAAAAPLAGLPADACIGLDPTPASFEFECAGAWRWFLILGDNLASAGALGVWIDAYVCTQGPGSFEVAWNAWADGVGGSTAFATGPTGDPTCPFGATRHAEFTGGALSAPLGIAPVSKGQTFRVTIEDEGGTVAALLLWPGA